MFSHAFSYLIIILFGIGFISQQELFILLALLILSIKILSYIWISYGKKHLRVHATNPLKATFRDTPFTITYSMENSGFLPYINGNLLISLHRDILVENLPLFKVEGFYKTYQLNVNIPPKSIIHHTITLKINKRGNYYLGDTSLVIADPFSFSSDTILKFLPIEIAIYPEIKPIKSPIRNLFRPNGNSRTNQRLFEDRMLPKGAREYTTQDPFYKIDWKQTGRMGTLYTKEFEQSVNQEVWILVNLKTSNNPMTWVNDEKIEEDIISTVASFAYKLAQSGFSYLILKNAKLARMNSLYKLYAGSKKDLGYILYELARFKSYKAVNYIHTLKAVKKHHSSHKPLILLVSTYLSDEVVKQVETLKREGYNIRWIHPQDYSNGELHDELVEKVRKHS